MKHTHGVPRRVLRLRKRSLIALRDEVKQPPAVVELAADGGRAVGRLHQIEQEVGLVLVELVGRPRPPALLASPPYAAVPALA